MRLNAVLVQKALSALSTAIYHLSQAIEPTQEDIAGYNALLKTKQALADAQLKAQRAKAKAEREPREDLKALRADLSREERKLKGADPDGEPRDKGQPKPQKEESGLPEKPMKQARMNEYLEGWLKRSKAHSVKNAGGFSPGMGCSVGGKEHVVKAVYSNGVALVNSKGTQYHRLVPVDQLEFLFLKDSGVEAKYAPGQRVEVGFGMKDAAKASSFRAATVVSVYGQSAQIKYLDTEMTSTAKLSHMRPAAK